MSTNNDMNSNNNIGNNIDYTEEYKDIINKSRPEHHGDDFEARHPHMSQENRAKIFAPFAALKGYEEAIDNASNKYDQTFDPE